MKAMTISALCMLWLAGCGEEPPCADITVNETAAGPEFVWNGGELLWLHVGIQTPGNDSPGNGTPVWEVECGEGEEACIESPVLYGSDLPGTREVTAPEALEPGIDLYIGGVAEGCTPAWSFWTPTER